jgi:F0F1-type ATP synthase epsilon subunit
MATFQGFLVVQQLDVLVLAPSVVEARGADQAITSAIDSHVQAERRGDDGDGSAGVLAPVG